VPVLDLVGASNVRHKLRGLGTNATSSLRMALRPMLQLTRRAWDEATQKCARAGHGHIMDGVEVILVEYAGKESYTARCWDDDRIFINVPRLAQQSNPARVLCHEYGHRVWFHCLSRVQRTVWLASYAEAKKKGELISSYSSTAATEDFAEVFATRVMCGKEKLPGPSRARWDRLIHAGTER
jgi:hypothetical protein